jgi:hypothetical protein
MSTSLLILVASSVFAQGQSPTKDQASPDEKTEAARAAEAAAITQKVAEAYRVTASDARDEALRLEPKSVLQWSNPVAGSFHGSVFIWTSKGRPEVIASIYKKYVPLPTHLGIEFHSLTEGRAKAERDGHDEWLPSRGGVEFKPIPDAPAPADTPAKRLRQLRTLAAEFSATETTRDAVTRRLRMLTQPIYRYESTDTAVLDGALFAFVEGTDPELFLLIEARAGDKGPTWHYALARMNSIEFHAMHKGREVWSATILPWAKAMHLREPYTLFTFAPGEGMNPPEEKSTR